MNRRTALQAVFGAAALAFGGGLLAREASALPGSTGPALGPSANPAVATEADLAEARLTQVQDVVVRRRPARTVIRQRPNGRIVVRRRPARIVIRRRRRRPGVVVVRPRRRRAIVVR
jgi:hypothetical protein